jgi:hypothetical protein
MLFAASKEVCFARATAGREKCLVLEMPLCINCYHDYALYIAVILSVLLYGSKAQKWNLMTTF